MVVTRRGAHRLVDPNTARGAGGDSLHSPTRGMLNYEDPLGQIAGTANQAGGMIKGRVEDVVAFIKATTGIDLSGPAALLTIPLDMLGGAELGKVLEVLGMFIPGLSGADPSTISIEQLARDFVELILNPTNLITAILDPDQPLNALNLVGQIPARLLGLIPLGGLSDARPNVLPNPGFDAASAIRDSVDWSVDNTVGRTVKSSVVGSATVLGDGLLHQLLSDPPTQTKPGVPWFFEAHVRWRSIVAAGPGWRLVVVAYTSSDGTGPGVETILDTISDPPANSDNPDPDEDDFVAMTGNYTVAAGINSIRHKVVQTPNVTAGQAWVDDADLGPEQKIQMPWVQDLPELNTGFGQVLDIVRGFSIVPINDDISGFQGWVDGLFTRFNTNEGDHQGLLNQLFGGFRQTSASGIGAGDVGTAAGDTAVTAETSLQLGEWVSAIQDLRNNKDLFEGVDETEEANFKLDRVWDNTGAEPAAVFAATSAAVPVAYKNFAETAKKGFISLFAKTADATNFVLDVYVANKTTNTWDGPIYTSPNLFSQLDNTWRYIVHNIADLEDRIDVYSGLILGIAYRVIGSGTVSIAGEPYNQPAHPSVHPKRPVSVRTGSGALTFAATAYTPTVVPWFGMGIIAGDVPPPFYAPRPVQFTTPGDGVYTIPPEFRVAGNIIDRVACGSGSGGYDSFGWIPGAAGNNGHWAGDSLIYGTHIPLGTATLNYHVAYAGTRSGNAGEASTSTGTSVPTLSAAGGTADTGSGDGPGDFTWAGRQYRGGTGDGDSPGSGGAGAIPWFPGGNGGAGMVGFVARQP